MDNQMKWIACPLASLALVLICFGLSIADQQGLPEVIRCTFKRTAIFDGKDGRVANAELSNDNEQFLIVGLDTDDPVLKGNTGASKLKIIMKGPDVVYLAEVTPVGNLNLFTIFPLQGIIIYSKQYPMPDGAAFGLMTMGTFKVR